MTKAKCFLFSLLCIVLFLITTNKKSFPQVTDIEGNNYKTVAIGNQVWIAENLNVSKYRNGEVIPQVQNNDEWIKLTTGAWCYYENKTENGVVYGKLYNWYAVTDPRGLAPEGWHIPDSIEWKIVEIFLGEDFAGKKMKSIKGWEEDEGITGNTNESGFNGLPGGHRDGWKEASKKGEFYNLEASGAWWSTSMLNTKIIWGVNLGAYADDISYWKHYKTGGLSVRCIKD